MSLNSYENEWMTEFIFMPENTTHMMAIRISPAHQHVLVNVSACNEQIFILIIYTYTLLKAIKILLTHKENQYDGHNYTITTIPISTLFATQWKHVYKS